MPANAASQPRIRSSSMACPTDSWICRASCSPPRISVVSPDGHSGAVSSARASSAIRGACAGQVELVDQLPAAGAVLPAVRRVGPPLGLAVADRGRGDARAALADVLVDAVPLAGDEPLLRVPDLVDALGQVGAGVARRRGGARPAGRPCRTAARTAGRSRTAWPSSPSPAPVGTRSVAGPGTRALAAAICAARAAGRAGRGVGQVGYGVEAPARARPARVRRCRRSRR